MQDTEDSILNQYKMEFKRFNIDLDFTSNAVEYVAEISENRKTGARALVSVWENILTDFQFDLPGSNFSTLKVNRELCEKPKDYLLKMLFIILPPGATGERGYSIPTGIKRYF